jgi:hypothetical protein
MRILALGCSYTSWKWPTWPTYLEQLLGPGVEIVNGGQKGDSNFIIVHKLNYFLKNYQWDKIIVMWTGSTRDSLIVDDTNRAKIAELQHCDLDIWEQIYANNLGGQLYVNINELRPEYKLFFPATGTLDHHIKSDYDVFLGLQMLQNSGIEYYNMFYYAHELRKNSIQARLGHIGKFDSFNWIDDYKDTFPFDTSRTGNIDNHPLPSRHFELAEKICDTLNLDKQYYTDIKSQATDITAKIKKIMDPLELQVTEQNKLKLRLQFNNIVARLPGCRDHKQFNLK